MNGVHDLGGMHGFGPIVREENEPVFHSDWERRMFALALSTMAARCFNVDEFRREIERMPPVKYLGASYYERWLHSIETLLAEKGIITRDELESAMRDPVESGTRPAAASMPSAPRISERVSDRTARKPRFRAGERVIAKNINPPGHTRLPRYARGKRGIVRQDWGVFVFPDSHAHGIGRNPQHCYGVEFDARELWGRDHPMRERVHLDLWEDYLEADRVARVKIKKVSAAAKPASTRAKTKTAARPSRKPPGRREKTR